MKKKRINKKPQLFRLNYKRKNSRFLAKFYDERDKFNFNVIRIPYKTNNILRKMFYLAMSAEILWISKTTTKFQDFIKSAKILIGRIIKQEGLLKHMK